MADSQEVHSTEGDEKKDNDLNRLKKDLEGYRELLLPLKKVLEWEQSHYPAILIAAITFIFAVVWYLEPSVLTTFSTMGVLICMFDFAIPAIIGYLYASSEWTIVQEREFESICTRLLNAKTHLENFKNTLLTLKSGKPKAYLLTMMVIFATLAWVGSLIDNLLLAYLLVVFIVMVPGLRKHGILQKITKSAGDVIQGLLKKASPPKKTN